MPADPLPSLRSLITNGGKPSLNGSSVEIGANTFSAHLETPIKSHQGRGSAYKLDALVFFLQHAESKHVEYFRACKKNSIQLVQVADKKRILAFLRCEIGDCFGYTPSVQPRQQKQPQQQRQQQQQQKQVLPQKRKAPSPSLSPASDPRIRNGSPPQPQPFPQSTEAQRPPPKQPPQIQSQPPTHVLQPPQPILSSQAPQQHAIVSHPHPQLLSRATHPLAVPLPPPPPRPQHQPQIQTQQQRHVQSQQSSGSASTDDVEDGEWVEGNSASSPSLEELRLENERLRHSLDLVSRDLTDKNQQLADIKKTQDEFQRLVKEVTTIGTKIGDLNEANRELEVRVEQQDLLLASKDQAIQQLQLANQQNDDEMDALRRSQHQPHNPRQRPRDQHSNQSNHQYPQSFNNPHMNSSHHQSDHQGRNGPGGFSGGDRRQRSHHSSQRDHPSSGLMNGGGGGGGGGGGVPRKSGWPNHPPPPPRRGPPPPSSRY